MLRRPMSSNSIVRPLMTSSDSGRLVTAAAYVRQPHNTLASPLTNAQPCLAVESPDSLVVGKPALALQKHMNSTIAVAALLRG